MKYLLVHQIFVLAQFDRLIKSYNEPRQHFRGQKLAFPNGINLQMKNLSLLKIAIKFFIRKSLIAKDI